MNRRALVIISLAAITILGAIALALALMTNDDSSPGVAEPTPAAGTGTEGVRFEDPQGAYRLDIDPAWRPARQSGNTTVERWEVEPDETTDQVEVETTTVGDVDLDQYLQLEIKQAPDEVDDFKLREFRVVSIDATNPSALPTQLGVVAYEGARAGEPVAYLLVSSVDAGRAVIARLTTTQEDFDEVRARVEPYLMTLRPT